MKLKNIIVEVILTYTPPIEKYAVEEEILEEILTAINSAVGITGAEIVDVIDIISDEC